MGVSVHDNKIYEHFQTLLNPQDFPNEVSVKEVFESLRLMIKLRSIDLCKHGEITGIIAYLLALDLGYTGKGADLMQYLGWIHDIGAIYLPFNMYANFIAGELEKDEKWGSLYRMHPVIGSKIIGCLQSLDGQRGVCSYAVLYHHENYDGSGFPEGLKGKEIPFEARILRVADAFTRLISPKPFGQGYSYNEALSEMLRRSKINFDPEVVKSLMNISDVIKVWLDLYEENKIT